MGYTTGVRFLAGAIASRPTLGLTQPPIHLAPGVKRLGHEADHSPPSNTEVQSAWSYTRVYPKVSGLAAWRENYKWYSSLPLGVVVCYFVGRCSEFCGHNPLCCFSTSVYCCKLIFRYRLSPETFGYTLVFPLTPSLRGA